MTASLRCVLLVIVLGVGAAGAGADQPPPSSGPIPAGEASDREALRALIPMYEQAVNEGRLELLKPYLAPQFSGVVVTGEQVDSFNSLQEYWAKIQKLIGENGKYHVTVKLAEQATLGGDLAIAHGTTEDVVTARGREFRFEGRWTAVCRKIDGQWKVHRIHASMDPVSNTFVQAEVRAASFMSAGIAIVIGVVIGWLIRLILDRRRTRPAAA